MYEDIVRVILDMERRLSRLEALELPEIIDPSLLYIEDDDSPQGEANILNFDDNISATVAGFMATLIGPAGGGDWVKLESQELASAASVVTFSSISQDYRDLIFLIYARSNKTGQTSEAMYLTLNNDTTAGNYISVQGAGNYYWGSSDGVLSGAYCWRLPAADSDTYAFGGGRIWIPQYKQTDHMKMIGGLGAYLYDLDQTYPIYSSECAGIWEATSAINRVDFKLENGGQFIADSLFMLYGIKE